MLIEVEFVAVMLGRSEDEGRMSASAGGRSAQQSRPMTGAIGKAESPQQAPGIHVFVNERVSSFMERESCVRSSQRQLQTITLC